jgi:subtilase family serine protease
MTSYFAAKNVAFFAVSGDTGGELEWPATDPHVVGVGGTTLQTDASGARSSEIAWSDTGGGVSAYFSAPSYQKAYSGNSMRTVPDVSMNADLATGYSMYLTSGGYNGWLVAGGTSFATPAWAALHALINEKRGTNLGQPLETYYNGASSGHYFYDITSGCNNSANTNCATVGYDDLTGMGVPIASALVSALGVSPPPAPASTPSSGSGGGCAATQRSPASIREGAFNFGLPLAAGALLQIARALRKRRKK